MRGLMTIDAVRRKSTRASRRAPQEELLPIGETDANIFNCPACARPLVVGTTRCPGCSTGLISGIRATRAAGVATHPRRLPTGRYRLEAPAEGLIDRRAGAATEGGGLHLDGGLLDLVWGPGFRFRRETAAGE